ncbi:Gfo/Idh/MocA family oxidoreductase [Brenneria izbisi]|uniref:Gfo/Idh/MocA family oxidoreductase n=1 Tax=Brenneria izbisi TaxID=2939450 RepID=A0AA42C0Z0_9GAMM|nr:Gfo/Idh/MocA family oxidoreductase [Brenneria izbisi]MCV9877657.1 Gfo/Idh/MocA family oxidoreductase [Brenneria izbisi]MCV9880778.1 Gfo/Idh/MocA family oxidoreductase [Brenneria izbisi]
MKSDKILTVGYIGNGKSTNRYHLPFVLQRKEKFHVKTIYSPSKGKKDWDAIPDVIYTNDINVLLNDPDIDLIVVCTPAVTHYELAKQVLNANKHCLVEKPFTHTTSQAKELFELAKNKNLVIQCYQNRRFDSDFLTVQKVIESGKLGDLLEVEMHYDYYRPYVPEQCKKYVQVDTYLYGHGCHTLDQVLSYFGNPDHIHYDVRQLLGEGRMNDYFDLDLYYGIVKVSVKSSFFRVKERPSFVVYGKRGMFIKEKKDRQEEHLKLFYFPDHADFGIDNPSDYGTIIYYDAEGTYHEEKVISEVGDYGRFHDALYESIVNGKEKFVSDEQTILQISFLEEGTAQLK